MCSGPRDRLGLKRNKSFYFILFVTFSFLLYRHYSCNNTQMTMNDGHKRIIYDSKNKPYVYGDDTPIIFVGGMPRSGTTLMRVMLDAHPEIRCGEETRIIPSILSETKRWRFPGIEKIRLDAAGLSPNILDSAVRAFILEIITKHGPPAPHLCNKDPQNLIYSKYLSKQFPNSKYILMIRDGRAVVHSLMTRNVTITGYNMKNTTDVLIRWNKHIEEMYSQCLSVGKRRCLPVNYEKLVLHPQEMMNEILHFLEIPWDDSVLHHEEYIQKPGGIRLSKIEPSTDQVIKPVNIEALTKWVGKLPDDVVQNMSSLAPMLAKLGYDPDANPPKYGKPDLFVVNNTFNIKKNADFWKKKGDKATGRI